MKNKNYRQDLIEFFIYFFALVCLFSGIKIFSRDTIRELTGANLVLAVAVVPCCILNYGIRRKVSVYLYLLIYNSLAIESVLRWVFVINGVYISELPFSFMYRTLLLIMIVYENSDLVQKIYKHQVVLFYASMFIDIILTLLYSYMVVHINIMNIIKPYYYIAIIISYYFTIKLIIKAYRDKEFIITIYTLNTIILGLEIFISTIANEPELKTVFTTDEAIYFFMAFIIVFIAMFIEMKNALKNNKELRLDVQTISEDIIQIKETEKFRSNFFANLSHEFRTPINILFSCFQLLKQKKYVSNEALAKSYLKFEPVIEQNCYRMIRLVNNFVDINKIQAGFLSFNLRNHNIVELVENITMSVVQYTENNSIELTFDTTEEEIIIQCNSDAIERIILNLLSNSIKFSKKDGHILVTVSADSNYVTIKVIDDGEGIKEEVRERIFDMFVQGDKTFSRANEGSGIGLSLVKALVELHKGIVYISDSVTCGTEMVVKLPNVKIENESIGLKDELGSDSDIIQKINIEFSDIYNVNA